MQIDPPLLTALAVVIGALVGGGASLSAAIYTQRYQDRLQRVARETMKREEVYADFIMSASKVILDALVNDGFRLEGEQQHLIGLANRMRLFAPHNVVKEAETVIEGIVSISLKPSLDLRKLTMADVSKNRELDLLLPFSVASRADLDDIYRTIL